MPRRTCAELGVCQARDAACACAPVHTKARPTPKTFWIPNNMTRKSTLSPASVELVAFLHSHGASTEDEIHTALSPGRPHIRPRDTAKRLNNLRALGHADFEVAANGAKIWYASQPALATPAAQAAGRPPGSSNKPKPQVDRSQLVPPPQYDRMRAPPYTEPPAQAVRPGALQFLQCASRGNRC